MGDLDTLANKVALARVALAGARDNLNQSREAFDAANEALSDAQRKLGDFVDAKVNAAASNA